MICQTHLNETHLHLIYFWSESVWIWIPQLSGKHKNNYTSVIYTDLGRRFGVVVAESSLKNSNFGMQDSRQYARNANFLIVL